MEKILEPFFVDEYEGKIRLCIQNEDCKKVKGTNVTWLLRDFEKVLVRMQLQSENKMFVLGYIL